MAITILQEPPALSFVGNLPDIIGHSDDTVAENFSISIDGSIILEETYVPDSQGRITIRIRELLDDHLSLAIPVGNLYEQLDAVKDVECLLGSEPIDFRIIKGGVDRQALNSSDFMAANWLTWQPQSKIVKYRDPEWLSYYPLQNVNVRVKGYFQGGTDQTVTKHTLTADSLYTINVNFQQVRSFFVDQPLYFDIWVENTGGTPLTYTQRYVLTDEVYDYDDLFVFENSLGGIDTVRFTGQKELLNKSQFDAALFFDEIELDYEVLPDRAFNKNTGYFHSKKALAWSQDFFSSLQKYIYEKENLVRILVKEPEVTDIKFELIHFDFKYIYTRQTKYLDLVKEDEYMDLLIIIGPDDEQYYLVPRLWEFPILNDPTDALFPVQTTGNAQWQTLSFQTILNYILTSIDIPDAGDMVISPGTLVINSPTSATLTGASWRKAGVIYNYTGPVTLTGSPSAPNSRVDIIYTLSSPAVGYLAGTPDEDPAVPNVPAGGMLLHTILRLNTGESIVTPVNPADPATLNSMGMWLNNDGLTPIYAPIWRQTLQINTYYDFQLAFVAFASDYTSSSQFPMNGLVAVNFVTRPATAEIDFAGGRVSVRTFDISSRNGDFVLMMTGANEATLFARKSAFIGNLTFQYTIKNGTVRKESLVRNGAYIGLPAGNKQYSYNGRDYVPSTGQVRFDLPRSYGYNGTPVSGSITFPSNMGDLQNPTRADENNMAKMLHNSPAMPPITPPAGVTLRLEGGEYEPNSDNQLLFICHKNDAGAVKMISFTITPNVL